MPEFRMTPTNRYERDLVAGLVLHFEIAAQSRDERAAQAEAGDAAHLRRVARLCRDLAGDCAALLVDAPPMAIAAALVAQPTAPRILAPEAPL